MDRSIYLISYDRIENFSEGLALVKWVIKMVILINYDRTYSFCEGLAAVQVGENRGYVAKPEIWGK
jgi:hypothetical protein